MLLVVGFLVYAARFQDIRIGVGTANVDDYDVTLDRCTVNESDGAPHAAGTITNTSETAQGFDIEIRFSDADGALIDTGSTFGKRVAVDQQVGWEITSNVEVAAGTEIECKIDEVSYSISD